MVDSARKSRTIGLASVREVVDALGGTVKTAALLPRDCKPQQISNAIARGFFPPWTFLILSDHLDRVRRAAPPALWQIEPVKKTKKTTAR